MVAQANDLLDLEYNRQAYMLFVFFSTLCSYNFHWRFTPASDSEMIRLKWMQRHKRMQSFMIAVGLAGAAWFSIYFIKSWAWFAFSIALTFLYSAPKLPYRLFRSLKKIAVGKTIFLSFVWTYVTAALPILIAGGGWSMDRILFVISRFFLIYAICIIFDNRDRDRDKQEGIRSMVTHFSEANVKRLFQVSVILFFISSCLLYFYAFTPATVIALLIPGAIVWSTYGVFAKNYSDYLYYFVLDGLMMLSALITPLISF